MPGTLANSTARSAAALARAAGVGSRIAAVGFGELVDLMARAIVATRNHRDAPPRHRRVGIELRGLQEAAFGFGRPEGMQLRESLIEELLRLRIRGGDRHVDVLGALAGHQMRGQSGRSAAGRGNTEVGRGFRLGESCRRKNSGDQNGLGHVLNSTPKKEVAADARRCTPIRNALVLSACIGVNLRLELLFWSQESTSQYQHSLPTLIKRPSLDVDDPPIRLALRFAFLQYLGFRI